MIVRILGEGQLAVDDAMAEAADRNAAALFP